MIQISVQTNGPHGPYSLDEAYRIIAEAGFDGVDAGIGRLFPSDDIKDLKRAPVFDGTDADICEAVRGWKEGAKKYGIANCQAHAPFPTHRPYQDGEDGYNAYLMEVLRKTVVATDFIDCRRLVVHPFFHHYTDIEDQQAEWERNVERYSALIPVAKQYGVTICLENMFMVDRGHIYAACCTDIGWTCRIIDELNRIAGERVFGFCLDTGHLALCGLDVKNAMTTLGDRIECFHVHDNDGKNDIHQAPYMGVQDWNRFIDGLAEIRFNKPMSFETYNIWNTFDKELCPEVMRIIAKTGRMFAERAEKKMQAFK